MAQGHRFFADLPSYPRGADPIGQTVRTFPLSLESTAKLWTAALRRVDGLDAAYRTREEHWSILIWRVF